MDNKLSELSKPVGHFTKQRDGNYWPLSKSTAKMNMVPLYSQEYVSALLAELEAKDSEIDAANARVDVMCAKAMNLTERAESAEQRIAELERANQSQDDHINQQQDRIDSLEKTNAGLGRGLAAAEKRLAIPVRLPEREFDDGSDKQVCILAGRFN
ncbi:MAG: hypothetical protein WBR09_01570, partial [Serratia proteamaculans]